MNEVKGFYKMWGKSLAWLEAYDDFLSNEIFSMLAKVYNVFFNFTDIQRGRQWITFNCTWIWQERTRWSLLRSWLLVKIDWETVLYDSCSSSGSLSACLGMTYIPCICFALTYFYRWTLTLCYLLFGMSSRSSDHLTSGTSCKWWESCMRCITINFNKTNLSNDIKSIIYKMFLLH